MKDKQIKKLVEAMEQGDNKAFEKLYNETSRGSGFAGTKYIPKHHKRNSEWWYSGSWWWRGCSNA